MNFKSVQQMNPQHNSSNVFILTVDFNGEKTDKTNKKFSLSCSIKNWKSMIKIWMTETFQILSFENLWFRFFFFLLFCFVNALQLCHFVKNCGVCSENSLLY
jgi:hypothetical protein